jgi:hypothetical protein
MMARSSKAPSIGRIQKRKTNFSKSSLFGLQRAAGPYRWVRRSSNGAKDASPFVRLMAGVEEVESIRIKKDANQSGRQ